MLAANHSALGDITSDISALTPYITTVDSIVTDPAFPQVMGLIQQIAAAKAAANPGAATAADGTSTAGIGLSGAVLPLEGYLWFTQNPVWGWVAVIGGIATPLVVAGLIGSAIGKSRQRKRLMRAGRLLPKKVA